MPVSPDALIEAGLPEAAAAAVAARARPFRAQRQDVLFRPGDDCAGYLVLTAGVIRVSLIAETGRLMTLYRVGVGDICLQTFQCLAAGERYSAEGVAQSQIEAALLSPHVFDDLLGVSPVFRRFVMGGIAARFGQIAQKMENTAFLPIDQRLAAVLLAQAVDQRVRLSHAEIAAEIGSVREVVSRRLAGFQRQGLTRAGRGEITLVDCPGLEMLAAASL